MNDLLFPTDFWKIILCEDDYFLSSWSLHYCLFCKNDSSVSKYITYSTHKRIYCNNETKNRYLSALRNFYEINV